MQPQRHEDVCTLVDQELQRVLPVGWSAIRHSATTWAIRPPHGWLDAVGPEQVYEVEVFGTRVLVTHENTDAGALHVTKLLQRATVIDVAVHPVGFWSLGELLWEVFRTRAPNRYGLT
jgi:hypothetical protein